MFTQRNPFRFVRTIKATLLIVLFLQSQLSLFANAAPSCRTKKQSHCNQSEPVISTPAIRQSMPAPPAPLEAVSQKLSDHPSDAEIQTAPLFADGIVPMHRPPIAGENEALGKALNQYVDSNGRNFAGIESFVLQFPASRWTPSMQLALAKFRFNQSYFSEAMALWESVWNTSKGETEQPQKQVADHAIGQLLFMDSRLGRAKSIESRLAEVGNRTFLGEPAVRVVDAREALESMKAVPERVFKCGPYALDMILRAAKPGIPVHQRLLDAKSSPKGMNLHQVATLAKEVGLDYRFAKRAPGAAVITPSVMHWKLGHFSALITAHQDGFQLEDNTLREEGSRILSQDAIDTESDGYFLIPKTAPLSSGWKLIGRVEAERVWGSAASYGTNNEQMGPAAPRLDFSNPGLSEGDGGGGTPNCGMPVADAKGMQARLHLSDTPLSYPTQIGTPMNISLNYNYRESYFTSVIDFLPLGLDWNLNWAAYVYMGNFNAQDVNVFGPGGGSEFYDSTTTFDTTPNYPERDRLSHAKLTGAIDPNTLARSWIRELPDGTKEYYTKPEGWTGRWWMTKIDDPQGVSTIIEHDSNYRIYRIKDASERYTTFTYVSNTSTNPGFRKIATITDPFGRTCSFTYDDSFTHLISITDMYGLTTTFTCVTQPTNSVMIAQMITPYGTTQFEEYFTDQKSGLKVVLPDGSTARAESWAAWSEGGSSYLWTRENSSAWPDTSKAFKVRWMMRSPSSLQMQAIPRETRPPDVDGPELPKTVYTYAGQQESGGHFYISATNPSNRPTEVKLVTQEATPVERAWQYTYNNPGLVTQTIDPLGRKFSFDYATADSIDLLAIRQRQGSNNDVMAQWTYNSSHLPLTYTDGSGQKTEYEYNSYGQLTEVTDANASITTLAYSTAASGTAAAYLTSINGPLASDTTEMAYDSVGRVQSVTDPQGYVVSMSYDTGDRLTAVNYPDGTSETIMYDRLDPVMFKDRSGRIVQQAFDSLRQLAYRVDSLSRKTSFEWCQCGALKALIDQAGRRTEFSYDAAARLIEKEYADNKTIVMAYDKFGQMASRQDSFSPTPQTTSYTYNSDGSLNTVQYTNEINPTPDIEIVYDVNYPRVSALATILGGTKTESYTYNPYIDSTATNNVFIWAGGSPVISDTVTLTIQGPGFNGGAPYSPAPVMVILEAGNPASLATSIAGSVNADAVLSAAGITAVASGTMVKFTRSPSNTFTVTAVTTGQTTVTNSGGGRLWKVANTSPASNTTLSYDKLGRVTKRTLNGTANVVSHTFDSVSRVLTEVNSLTPSSSIDFTYLNSTTGDRRPASIAYPSNAVATTFSWFANNLDKRLQQISHSNGGSALSTFSLSYAPAGDILQWQQLQNATNTRKIFENDFAARLITAQSVAGSQTRAFIGGSATTSDVLTLTFTDPVLGSSPVSVAHTVTSGQTLAQIATDLKDAVNASTALSTAGITATVTGQTVKINSTSVRATTISASRSTGATESIYLSAPEAVTPFSDQLYYAYDSTDNLVGVQHTAGNGSSGNPTNIRTFTVDASVNQLSAMNAGGPARFKGTANRGILGASVNSNAVGLPTSTTFAGNANLSVSTTAAAAVGVTDPSGSVQKNYTVNVTGPSTASHAFDANGNMLSDGTNTYLWDAENRLVKITYPSSAGNTSFEYDAQGRCTKITESNNITVTGSSEFIWCGTERCEQIDKNALGIEISRKRFFDSGVQIIAGGNTVNYFYARDHLGSVRELVKSDGTVQARYSYSPFGEKTVVGTETTPSDFGFAGMYQHSRSGLNLTLFRAYNPSLGRWLSRDPLEESMGVNLYAYVLNDPINLTDVLGLFPRDSVTAAYLQALRSGDPQQIAGMLAATEGVLNPHLSQAATRVMNAITAASQNAPTALQLLNARLQRSPSFHKELQDLTLEQLKALAAASTKKSDPQVLRELSSHAADMLKLIKQQQRLMEQQRNCPR